MREKTELMKLILRIVLLILIVVAIQSTLSAQTNTDFQPVGGRTWINTYGTFELKNNFFWNAQTHFRYNDPLQSGVLGQFAQLYNRHGIGYVFSKNFNLVGGFVYRFNRNTNFNPTTDQRTTSEWRIWHQYQFVSPFPRFNVYQRLRIEHRWSRGFSKDADFIFRNRFRYQLNVKIPLNKTQLKEDTFYLSPEAELIMQSGPTVGGSPMEDLRLVMAVGYIVNYRMIVSSGFMYSFGQDLSDPYMYGQNLTFKFHVYYFFNLKKLTSRRLPFRILN